MNLLLVSKYKRCTFLIMDVDELYILFININNICKVKISKKNYI